MAGSGTAHLRPDGRGAAPRRASRRRVPGRPHRPQGARRLRRQPRHRRGRDARARRRVRLRQVDHRARDHAAAAARCRAACSFDGTELTALKGEALRKLRPRMQMIFQDPISSLNPRRKVRDIVAEGLEIWKIGDKRVARRRRSTRCSRPSASIPRTARRRPHEFSGGQCQRISIARAVVDRAEAHHLRRAGLRARRVGAGPDPQPAPGHEGRATG